ncbi:MAG: hypothetical protein WCH11_02030 [Bdellovibrio sp.]
MKKVPLNSGKSSFLEAEASKAAVSPIPALGPIQNETLSPEDLESLHQVLHALEAFSVPETLVTVSVKDPSESVDPTDGDEKADFPDLKGRRLGESARIQRICIAMTTDGNTVEAEAVGESLHEALVKAKDRLLHTLYELQNAAVSNNERQAEIFGAISGEHLIH